MAKGRFELNKKTVGELLKSQEIADACMQEAKRIAGNAGPGYKAKTMSTRVIVVPDTQASAQDNLDNNTLLKAAHK